MAKPERNAPCRCGSGIKYKNCHWSLDSAPPAYRLQTEHDAYNRRWQTNSAAFEAQGCYSWTASIALTRAPSLLMDVGCGDGRGIKALLQTPAGNSLRVIGIDENISCLRAAAGNLRSTGFSVELLDRTQVEITYGKHSYTYGPIAPIGQSQVTLLQSDILTDPHLESYIQSLGKLDAITVWLIGTHFDRDNCADIAHLHIASSRDYRLRVQNSVYAQADRLLKTGGVLQIVDRGEVPKTQLLIDDTLNAHRDQASVTSLTVTELKFMEYQEPITQIRVAMQPSPGTSGRVPDLTQTAMTSVLSTR